MICRHFQLSERHTRKVRCPECGDWAPDYSIGFYGCLHLNVKVRIGRGGRAIVKCADCRKRGTHRGVSPLWGTASSRPLSEAFLSRLG